MMLKMEEELNFGVMVHIIMVNIKMVKSMVEECTIGLMVLVMLEIGNKMKCTARVSLYGLMVDVIKVNLEWEWWKEKAYTNGKMGECIKENIWKIKNMGLEFTYTLMEADLKDNGEMGNKMELDI